MLNLGAHARRIVQQQKFRIPKVEANVTDKFMSTLSNYILNDAIRGLKQEAAEENYQIDEVDFTKENLEALDDSEVARKVTRSNEIMFGIFARRPSDIRCNVTNALFYH